MNDLATRATSALCGGLGFAVLAGTVLYVVQGVSIAAVSPVALLVPFALGAVTALVAVRYGYVAPTLVLAVGLGLALSGWPLRTILRNEFLMTIAGVALLGYGSVIEATARGDLAPDSRRAIASGLVAGTLHAVSAAVLSPRTLVTTVSRIASGAAGFEFVVAGVYFATALFVPVALAVSLSVYYGLVLPLLLAAAGVLLWVYPITLGNGPGFTLVLLFWPLATVLICTAAAVESLLRTFIDRR